MMKNELIEPNEVVKYEQRLPPTTPVLRGGSDWQADPLSRQDYVSLSAAWHIIVKRRWLILTTVLVLTTFAAVGSFRATPIYKAVSQVEVEAETPTIQSLNNLYQTPPAYTDDVFVQTQIEVLKSDNLAWRTVEQLRLGDNPQFAGPKDDKAGPEDPAVRKARLIAMLKGGLSVELVPKTRMLVVGFESPDPNLAALISSTHVNNYVDYNFREKYNATRQASGWMEQQLDELKAKVEQSQQALVDYEREHAIANTGEKENVQEQMLSDVSKDLMTAQSERIQKESLYNEVRDNREQMTALVHNELLQRLEEKQADLQNQYTDAINQYGPRFPKATRLQQQLEENQRQIQQEQNRVIERIRSDYLTALSREKLALQAVAKQRTDLGQVNQMLVQHNILQREFQTNQEMYQNLLQRLKDATVSAGLRSTNIHIVDTALTPTAPIRPRKMLNIVIGLFAGLILGVMLAFGQEALDSSVKSAEEIESILPVPALAMIPAEGAGARTSFLVLKRPQKESQDPTVGLTVAKRPTSPLAEAYRALRTAVLLSVAARPPKTLLITSSNAGEGKTTTALNLAQALAQRKGPVLLLDCDMRKSGIAQALDLGKDKGLSTILTGGHHWDECLQESSEQPGLWILPSGPTPPNPAELLSSEKMAELLEAFEGRFEQIVIDSPPVLAVTDSTILSTLTDGVVVVVECGATPKAALTRTYRTLESAGARVLGVILNKLDARNHGYYSGYYSYYRQYPYGGQPRK